MAALNATVNDTLAGAGSDGNVDPVLQTLQVLRVLRLARVFKLLKMGSAKVQEEAAAQEERGPPEQLKVNTYCVYHDKDFPPDVIHPGHIFFSCQFGLPRLATARRSLSIALVAISLVTS